MAVCNTTALKTEACASGFLCVDDPATARALKLQLLCNMAESAPEAPLTLTVDLTSLNGATNLDWTQGSAPTTNEVWRSINGAAYALLSTVAGAITTLTDATVLAAGDLYTYKVRACDGVNCSAFTTPAAIGNLLNPTPTAAVSYPDLILHLGTFDLGPNAANLISFSAPRLARVNGNFSFNDCSLVTSISIPDLVRVVGNLSFSGATPLSALSSLILTSLQTIDDSFDFDGQSTPGSLVALNLPALLTVGVQFNVLNTVGLTTISTPLVQSVGTDTNVFQNANLASINFPALTTVGQELSISLNSITTASFASLTSIGTQIVSADNTNLTSVSFPSLASVTGPNLNFNSCFALATFSAPNVIFSDGIQIDFTDNALLVASVNQILARGVASATTTANYELAGGTNAAPAGQGIIDKAALIVAGNGVNTN